jgi:hypothetical protein
MLTIAQLRELTNDRTAAAHKLAEVMLCLESEEEEIRAWASDVLENIGAPPASYAEHFASLCQHDCAAVAGWACKLLSKLGAPAVSYQSVIVRSLRTHASLGVRQLAAAALGQLPELEPDSLQALKEAAADQDPRLKRLAEQSLELASSRCL